MAAGGQGCPARGPRAGAHAFDDRGARNRRVHAAHARGGDGGVRQLLARTHERPHRTIGGRRNGRRQLLAGRRRALDRHRRRVHVRERSRSRRSAGVELHRALRRRTRTDRACGGRPSRPNMASIVEVVVTTPGGTSYSCPPGQNNLHYEAAQAPEVDSLNPHGGRPKGGTVVTIEGTGFAQNEVSPSAVTAVNFGSSAAKNVEFVSAGRGSRHGAGRHGQRPGDGHDRRRNERHGPELRIRTRPGAGSDRGRTCRRHELRRGHGH